jgi:hypothetical protein
MSKNPIYACLFLILLITSFILSMYSETKNSSSTADSKLQNYVTYTCISTIGIMIFISSIMVMFYQLTCNTDNNLNLFNNNDSADDNYDDYDDDDYDDDDYDDNDDYDDD